MDGMNTMRQLLIMTVILTLPASIGFAHIEETWSQCDARYGKPASSIEYSGHYRKDGILIHITFDEMRDAEDDASARRSLTRHGMSAPGKAVEVEYTKDGANAYFPEGEVKALLIANAGAATHSPDVNAWQPVRRKPSHEDYLRFDSKAKARVYWEYIDGANVSKRVEIKMIGASSAAHAQKAGEQLDTIEKDF
jgi:hypothetical protein